MMRSMRDLTGNLAAIVATGLTFALGFWVLQNMGDVPLFFVLAFMLGGGAEAFRRWVVEGMRDDA